MNNEMAYLLGMICGNGRIKRERTETTVSIDIPHKKLKTEFDDDVDVYVKASITDIRQILEPLTQSGFNFIQEKRRTVLSFDKSNSDYLMREILQFIGSASSHENIRIGPEIYDFTNDERLQFLRGFSDVTGYIRRSNYFFEKYMHRVYLEIPYNWGLVIDICNILRSIDIPVQNIDWAHPNMRDSNLNKYNEGYLNYWKKEHQIKIYANEFIPIGFGLIHKKRALSKFSDELKYELLNQGKNIEDKTHKYYWETRDSNKKKKVHPSEDDDFIPDAIRGNHYDSWKDIAKDLGYGE